MSPYSCVVTAVRHFSMSHLSVVLVCHHSFHCLFRVPSVYCMCIMSKIKALQWPVNSPCSSAVSVTSENLISFWKCFCRHICLWPSWLLENVTRVQFIWLSWRLATTGRHFVFVLSTRPSVASVIMYKMFVNTTSYPNRLWKVRQIYNIDAVGDKDELVTFWL